MVEAWLEAEFRVGYAIVWWMELRPSDERWTLSACASINGQDEFVRFEDASGLSYPAMKTRAMSLLAELLACTPPTTK